MIEAEIPLGALASGVTVKAEAAEERPAPLTALTSSGSAGSLGEPEWL